MERIREALQRARKERTEHGLSFINNPKTIAPFIKKGAHASVDTIVYTQTPTIEVSRAFLREQRVVSGFEQSSFTDAYKLLCTQILQKLRDNKWNSLAITSAGEHEGKTLTAINLAISLATEIDQTVLLVDADLRHPSVHTYFGLSPRQGLGDYLISDSPLENLLIHPDIGHLVILPGGKPLSNSSEMLGSSKMMELVQELKKRYPSRIVLFDLPPLLSAADALAFSPFVDATLLVVEAGKTQREDVSRAAELLSSTHLIGAVLNKSLELTVPIEKSAGWLSKLFKRKGH